MQEQDLLNRLLHFDPVQVIVIVASAVTIWTKLRSSVRWHTEWISKHSEECAEYKKDQRNILAEMQKMNTGISVLVQAHDDRLDRLERTNDDAGGGRRIRR